MTRDPGPFTPRRPHKVDTSILSMLLNGLHDRDQGQVFVLKVGAGTGETCLLTRFRDDGWSGLLVDPQPQSFARLEAMHVTSDRVAALSLGISDIAASLPRPSCIPDTASDVACIDAVTAADLMPFRVADRLVGLAPARLSVPLDELLTFSRKGLGAQPEDDV